MPRTRRRLPLALVAAAAALATSLAPAVGSALAAPGEATNYLIDAGRSSSQPTGGPAGTLREAWHADLNDDVGYTLIAGGRVFASTDETVVALDAATGRLLWSRRETRSSGLAYAAGRLIASACLNHEVRALDPATGAVAWKTPTTSCDGEPITDGTRVVLRDGGVLKVLSAATGALLWSDDLGGIGGLAIHGGEVFVAENPEGFEETTGTWAYTLATGVRRALPRGSSQGRRATFHHDLLYLTRHTHADPDAFDPYLGATLNPATGAQVGELWPGTWPQTDDARGTYLIDEGRLYAYGTTIGTARWTFRPSDYLFQAPVATGGRVWAETTEPVGGEGHLILYGLDPATGTVAQRVDAGAPAGAWSISAGDIGAMSAGGGLLLVPNGFRLVALRGDAAPAGSPTGPATGVDAPSRAALGPDRGATSERQDAARSGLAPGAPDPPLAPRWRTRIGKPMGPPLIAGDVAVLVDRVQGGDPRSSSDDAAVAALTAYGLGDGAVRWRRAMGGDPRRTWRLAADPAAGRLYAFDGETVTALALSDGHALWSHDRPTSDDRLIADPSRWTAPLTIGGNVYASFEGAMIALDGATGAVRWTDHLGLTAGSRVLYPVPPVADDARIYLRRAPIADSESACAIAALDRRTGALVWKRELECWQATELSLGDGRLSTGRVRLDAATGAERGPEIANGGATLTAGLDLVRPLTTSAYYAWSGIVARRPGADVDGWELTNAGPPLLAGPFTYAEVQGNLTAARTADGTIAWSAGEEASDALPRLAASGGVIAEAGDDELVVWAHADTGAPVVRIASPPSPAGATTAKVAFTVPAGASAACAVDGGAFAACASPWTTPTLAAGTHALRVRATLGGVSGPVATTRVAVDRTAPATTVVNPPPTYVNNYMLRLTADEPARFRCVLDGAQEEPCGGPIGLYGQDGPHELRIRAVDVAGNVEPTWHTVRWTRDNVPPQLTLGGVPARTASDTVTAQATASEPVTLECRLDGAAWASCPDPLRATAATDGYHVLDVRPTDRAGNVGTVQTAQWRRATKGPELKVWLWFGRQSWRGDLSVPLTPEGEPVVEARCRVDAEPWQDCTGRSSYERTDLADGHHVFQYRARDDLGNTGPVSSAGFDVARATLSPPSLYISYIGANEPSAYFTYNNPPGAVSVDCRIDAITSPCPDNGSWPISGLAAGWHTVQLTAHDADGHVAHTLAFTWSIARPDGTVPGTRPAGDGYDAGPPPTLVDPAWRPAYTWDGAAPPPPDPTPTDPTPTDPTPTDPTPTDPTPTNPTPTDPTDPTPTDPTPTDPTPTDPTPTDPNPGDTTSPADDPAPPGAVTVVPPPPVPVLPTPLPPAALPPAFVAAASGPAPAPAPAPRTTLAAALRAATAHPDSSRRAVVVALRAPAAGRVRLTLARGRTTLTTGTATARAAGTPLRVTLHATAAGRRLLARRGAVRVTLRARLAGATASRTVTLRR